MNLKNSRITLNFVVIAALLVLLTASGAWAGKTQIPQGQKVKVRFNQNMVISSGKLMKGLPLLIELAEPIVIGGKTIVEAGAEGKAEVVDVREASKPGKPGYLKIAFTELSPKGEYKSKDGAKIIIKGEQEATGKPKKLMSWLFCLGLFISGTEATLDVNKTYEAEVVEAIILQSEE
nr:hypothetical protein [candidate division Zixibacteria bacterium]